MDDGLKSLPTVDETVDLTEASTKCSQILTSQSGCNKSKWLTGPDLLWNHASPS